MLTVIKEFEDEYAFLSNMYPCEIVDNNTGCTFHSAEALFQAYKTHDLTLRAQFALLSGADAQRLAGKIRVRLDWEKVKYAVMYHVLHLKFSQNPALKEQLLDTDDALLVNEVNDLGRLLMNLRDELASEKV